MYKRPFSRSPWLLNIDLYLGRQNQAYQQQEGIQATSLGSGCGLIGYLRQDANTVTRKVNSRGIVYERWTETLLDGTVAHI